MDIMLSELIGDESVVAMLGMCKNAGKTTALNRLIREYADINKNIAVTSIGRDGESIDLVTGTSKPRIYIHEGTLVATAADLLRYTDVTREILDVTDIMTPLGKVVVFMAKSGGYVQLAGPSIVSEMNRLRNQLQNYGAETVLIDGAINRRTPASGAIDGACVLSTGASLNPDMDTVISETKYVCELLTLPQSPTITNDLSHTETSEIAISGAFTDSMAKAMLQNGTLLDDSIITLEDATKIMLSRETYNRLRSRHISFHVNRNTKLAAITINPVSAGGWQFDANAFLEEMQKTTPIPVINVMNEKL